MEEVTMVTMLFCTSAFACVEMSIEEATVPVVILHLTTPGKAVDFTGTCKIRMKN